MHVFLYTGRVPLSAEKKFKQIEIAHHFTEVTVNMSTNFLKLLVNNAGIEILHL